jgi:amidase
MPGDVIQRPALEQAAAVRTGEVSARELVEATLATIERLNGDVNAFVTVAAERALSDADAIEAGDPRPLAGVPIAIKDIGPLTEGIRTTFGSAVSGDWVPPFDTAIVKKLRDAGAVIVGKTSTPEFGITPVTEPARFGPTRNPWDLSRTAGGSSGGSAAAVASGMVGLAHGNDGGGSIRIPASCCGLVGLKPSRGRVSAAPLVESPSGLVAEGVLTRTVADTAVALDIVAGYEWGDPHWPGRPESSFLDAARAEPRALRIGLCVEPPVEARVDEECATAARDAAALLESLGHTVEESAPRWDAAQYVDSFFAIWGAEAAAAAERMGAVEGGQFDPADTEPLTQELIRRAHETTGIEVLNALTDLRAYSRRVARWWADHDVLLTPTLALPPIPHGALAAAPDEPPMEAIYRGMRFVPFCPPANITGQPAISLPLHQSADGLPVGVQLMGPPGGEELLLSLAAQVEQARPWRDRRPALASARSAQA